MKVGASVVKVKSPELKIMTWKMLFGQICVKTLKKICVCFDFGEKQNINITKYFRFLDKN